jgi:hypothetical protein
MDIVGEFKSCLLQLFHPISAPCMYKYMSFHSFPAATLCFLFSKDHALGVLCLFTLVVLFPYFGCFFCFSCLCCSFFSVSWVISFSFYVLLSIMAESSNTAVLVTS